jgi:glutamine amidotransferase
MGKLCATGLAGALRQLAGQGKPLMGICLGMQLLFDESLEFGRHAGLGLVPGRVVPLQGALAAAGCGHKVPHMGWNPLEIKKPACPLLANTQSGEFMYYVHSYYATGCEAAVAADSEYGVRVPGVVWRKNVYGAQFHPEKSGGDGLKILKAFAEVA